MKKQRLLLIAFTSLLVTSCSNTGRFYSKNNPVASLINSMKNQENSVANEASSSLATSETTFESSIENISSIDYPKYENIDIDLTKMSATLVYSEVYNMMDSPSNYIDKIVKVSGPFRPFESNDPNYCYPAIVVKDATACCANGLEFLLYGVPRCSIEGGNGYPLYDEEATIVGKFATYLEDRYMYVHLIDAIWLKD